MMSRFSRNMYSAFGKSLCTYKRCWKWCPRASIQACIRLILFANTFCRSAFGKSLCTNKMCWNWCLRASIQAGNVPYRSLSAQRLSECNVVTKLYVYGKHGQFWLSLFYFAIVYCHRGMKEIKTLPKSVLSELTPYTATNYCSHTVQILTDQIPTSLATYTELVCH
jgi:hypothetical protein